MKSIFSFRRVVIMTLAALFLSVGTFSRPVYAATSEASADAYTVQIPGDSLWQIAGRTCGNPYRWKSIADANKIFDEPYWVELGQTITIPCTTHIAAAIAPKQIPVATPVVMQDPQPAIPYQVTPAALPLNVTSPTSAVTKNMVEKLERHIRFLGTAFGIVVGTFVLVFLAWRFRHNMPKMPKRHKKVRKDPYGLTAKRVEFTPEPEPEPAPEPEPIVVAAEEVAPAPVLEELVPTEPAPIVPAVLIFPTPKLVDPTPEMIEALVTIENPMVPFTLNGVSCLAAIDHTVPLDRQDVMYFYLHQVNNLPTALFKISWKQLNEQVAHRIAALTA